ncbi:hypothetical protein [Aliiroseovarius sp. YM-037]|uniref:hypothetical protein n=1 Tax=Aliiroseovarius sp. YM-037 TaxID=3341728 RepID=UPI003A800359
METLIDRYTNDDKGSKTVDWLIFGTGLLSLVVAMAMTFNAPETIISVDATGAQNVTQIEANI